MKKEQLRYIQERLMYKIKRCLVLRDHKMAAQYHKQLLKAIELAGAQS